MARRASGLEVPRAGILDWDTDFFGFRVGRVFDAELTRDGAREVLAWALREGVQCVYFLADARDSASAHAAEDVGFRLMDVRVKFGLTLVDRDAHTSGDAPAMEFALPADIPALRDIARVSHVDSRFYADPRFPREHCAELYGRWIEGSCKGDADAVLVDRVKDRAAAYVTCHLESDVAQGGRSGKIGLVAVAEWARSRSLGGRLIAASVAWFAKNGADRIRVVTQGRNVAAARLYERAGFATQRVDLWFHLWPSESPR